MEEFTIEGKSFFSIDFSGIISNKDFIDLTNTAKLIIAKYPKHSLYTVSNISNIRGDTQTKEIFHKYLEHNKPYVKHGAIIGVDGIKKMMAKTIMKLTGRKDFHYAYSREEAIEWLLLQD